MENREPKHNIKLHKLILEHISI